MYAIIEDSGRQFLVREQDTINVDLRELPEGAETVEFDRVLLVGDFEQEGATRLGQPWLEGARVIGRLQGELLGDKVKGVKYRRRKGYRRKYGHRQRYLRVTIDKIHA